MKKKAGIDRFVDYFEAQIARIGPVQDRLYKKILFACLLDALSIARFPDRQSNDRLICFLLDCCPNAGLNRVSLVQLEKFLNHSLSAEEKENSQLLPHVASEVAKMLHGRIYRGEEVDPYHNRLDSLSTDREKEIAKLARYVRLFYAYRNEMVHGFKDPGHSIEMSDDGKSPYYHGYCGEGKSWQLVFPVQFFEATARETLHGLRNYLESQDIDPYEQYEFGEMWVKSRVLDSVGKDTQQINARDA